jgi:hypothetical protein
MVRCTCGRSCSIVDVSVHYVREFTLHAEGTLAATKRSLEGTRRLAGGRYHWRTADVGARIPPPAVVTRQRLRSHPERPAHIPRGVPPLARIACQGLRPDTQRPAHVARRIPPLAGVALLSYRTSCGPTHFGLRVPHIAVPAFGRAHCRSCDRCGGHRCPCHHHDGNQMTNERPHCGPPPGLP